MDYRPTTDEAEIASSISFALRRDFGCATISLYPIKEENEMNCVNCGTWNPEDKEVCWRCQTLLPIPEAPKPKAKTFGGLPAWAWIAIVVLFFAMNFASCSALAGRALP